MERGGRSWSLGDLLDVMKAIGSPEQWRRMFVCDTRRDRRVYWAYIGSVAWQHKRRAAIERSGGMCECGRMAVQAHHKTYARIGDELPEDLEAICLTCHAKEHGKMSSASKNPDFMAFQEIAFDCNSPVAPNPETSEPQRDERPATLPFRRQP